MVTRIVLIMSIIVPSSHTGIEAWLNSKTYTTIVYCTRALVAMQGYRTNTEYTGSLGYNLVFYITSRIGWVSLTGIFRYNRCRRNPGILRKITPRLVIYLLGIKTFRRDQRLQLHNFFMVFKRVPRWDNIGLTINIREKPPVILNKLH